MAVPTHHDLPWSRPKGTEKERSSRPKPKGIAGEKGGILRHQSTAAAARIRSETKQVEHRCPTCGHPLDQKFQIRFLDGLNRIVRNGVSIYVTPTEGMIAKVLVRRFGLATSFESLYMATYGDALEPANKETIRVFLSKLRRKFAELGCQITTVGDGFWRLEEMPKADAEETTSPDNVLKAEG